MVTKRTKKTAIAKSRKRSPAAGYHAVLSDVVRLLEDARRTCVREINTLITTTYWGVGRRIVETEQAGRGRAKYGEGLLERLSQDLTARFGRGFSVDNLEMMRLFYLTYPAAGQISETASRKSEQEQFTAKFPLPWSHYVTLIRRSRSPEDRAFYEAEALRGGWSVRQLERQINSQFYERTALSRNKAAMLKKG